MNNIDIVSILPVLIIAFVLFIVLVVILRRIFVNVGAREIAIKERRYFGRRMPPGRVVVVHALPAHEHGAPNHSALSGRVPETPAAVARRQPHPGRNLLAKNSELKII